MPGHFTLWESWSTSTLSGRLAQEVAWYWYQAQSESVKVKSFAYVKKIRDCIIQVSKTVWRATVNIFNKLLNMGSARDLTAPCCLKKKVMNCYTDHRA
jgi:hypothetical protein